MKLTSKLLLASDPVAEEEEAFVRKVGDGAIPWLNDLGLPFEFKINFHRSGEPGLKMFEATLFMYNGADFHLLAMVTRYLEETHDDFLSAVVYGPNERNPYPIDDQLEIISETLTDYIIGEGFKKIQETFNYTLYERAL
jgi:hypothetical protein